MKFLDQAGLDALGEGWEEHTPVGSSDLGRAEAQRLLEIASSPHVRDLVVNGRDWEGILCVQIATSFDAGYDLYCVYPNGDVALHNINQPRSYRTFAAFTRERS